MSRRLVLTVLLLVLAAATILHMLRGQRVAIELDTRTLFLYDEKGIHTLPRGSVVVVNVYMPYPGGLLRAAGAVEAPGRLSLSVPTGGAVKAWLGSGLPGRGRYPLLTVLVIAYTPQGEYIGGEALDPLNALLTLHAEEYKNPEKLDEAYTLLDKNPVKLLEKAYSGTLSLAGTILYKADIGGNIDYAIEKAREIAHVEQRSTVVHGALPDGTRYTAVVYNPILYNLRDRPPRAWYQRVLIGGGPAPKQLVDQLWRAYATHFSMEYIFPGNTSLRKILAFAYAARDARHIYLVRAMTEFLRDLEAAVNGRWMHLEWRDITPSLPEASTAAPIACLTVEAQGVKGNESTYLFGTLKYGPGVGFAATGTALEGLEAIGESIRYKTRGLVTDAVSGSVPVACIEASSVVSPGYAPGYAHDVVITLVDVHIANGHWVVKPFAVLLPSLRLETDYSHAYVHRLRGSSPVPAAWRSFLWHSVLRDTRTVLYNGSIPAYNAKWFLGCSLAVQGAGTGFSCMLLDYYFPYLAAFMHRLGLVDEKPVTIAELVKEARSSGYGAFALEESTIAASSVHISLTAMDEGLWADVIVYSTGDSSVRVVVAEDSVPGIVGLHVLLGRYWVTAYAESGDPARG